ncbi:MAG: DUF4202 domain-containing protein [Polyangiaceae bacterium]|nr:DUF4202 domain-containing protein [Polyangiaceae bacterium]
MTDAEQVAEVQQRLNELNSADPHFLEHEGRQVPKELLEAERREAWVRRLVPEPSPALLIASRGQHVERWKSLRSDYPEGRVGYLKWRKDLSKAHAATTMRIAREVGVAESTVEAIGTIIRKEKLKTNADSQAIEDALCLSFLEFEYDAFIEKYNDEQVVNILQKTWGKMSEKAHDLALQLHFEGRGKTLILRALGMEEP